MLGNPSSVNPVPIWFSAGPWVLLRAVIEWTKHISSTSSPKWGRRSDTYLPLRPRGRNAQGLWVSAPCSPWKVTSLSPPGSGCPWRLINSGLWSHVSRWLQAPEQKMTRTRLARGAKCGGRAASGASGRTCGRSGAASRSCPRRRLASAIDPRPVAVCARNPRRFSRSRPAIDRSLVITQGTSLHVNEFVRVEQCPAQRRQAVLAHEFGRGALLCLRRRSAERVGEGAFHLRPRLLPRLLRHPPGEERSLLHHERAVHEV